MKELNLRGVPYTAAYACIEGTLVSDFLEVSYQHERLQLNLKMIIIPIKVGMTSKL